MNKHIAGTVAENGIIEFVEEVCTENWNIWVLYGIQISYFKILRWFNPNFNSDSFYSILWWDDGYFAHWWYDSIETFSEHKQRIFIVSVIYDKHTVMIWELCNIKIVWTLWGKEKLASN
jgi:hypothetical protein